MPRRAPGDVLVAASILSADFAALGAAVRQVDEAGTDWVHFDVMDGHFVPNLTFGPPVLAAIRRCTQKPIDVHLMVERPEDLIPEYVKAGANSITVHAETCPHLQRTLTWLGEQGVRRAVALNPGTPLAMIEDVIADLDMVLIMTVNPGFGGQKFISHSLDKLRRCRDLLDRAGSGAEIEVDGGINHETAGQVVAAGATVLVAGNYVFSHPEGPAAGIQALRSGAKSQS